MASAAARRRTASRTATARLAYNQDDVPNVSITDGAESKQEPWTMVSAPEQLGVWTRALDVSEHAFEGNHVWHADDLGTNSDGFLTSPDLVVGSGDLVTA